MLPPAVGEREERVVERRLTRRDSQRRDPAFKQRNALFQNVGRRVGDTAVAIARSLEVEHRGRLVGALELISHVLIDRRRHRAGRGIAAKAAVNGDGLASHELKPPHDRDIERRAASSSSLLVARSQTCTSDLTFSIKCR